MESLHKTREQIRQAYADVDPELAELLREDADAVINIGVYFGGTWQKRGFTSHYGIGVCIDILTGLVIDFEVLSSYCHACVLKQSAKNEGKITVEEFDNWRESTQGLVSQWSRRQQRGCGPDQSVATSCGTLRCSQMGIALLLRKYCH